MFNVASYSPTMTLFFTMMLGGSTALIDWFTPLIASVLGVVCLLGASGALSGRGKRTSALFFVLLITIALMFSKVLHNMSHDAHRTASFCTKRCLIDITIHRSNPSRASCRQVQSGAMKLRCGMELRVPFPNTFVPGSRYRVRGAIRPSSHGSNARFYLKPFHSAMVGRESGWGTWLNHARTSLRRYLSHAVDREHRGILWALISGSKEWMKPSERDTWSLAGMIHLVAISGMHLGTFVLLVQLLTRLACASSYGNWRFHSTKKLMSFLAILLTLGFLLMWWHAPPSAIRSAGMWSVALLAQTFAIRIRALDALGTSGLVILLSEPTMCRDLGFQLSSLAVLGLLWADRTGRDGFLGLATSLRSSLAATLFTAPITGSLFGVIPILGIILNVLAAPLVLVLVAPLAIAIATGCSLGFVTPEPVLLMLFGVTEVLQDLARFGATWSMSIDFGVKHFALLLIGIVGLRSQSSVGSVAIPILIVGMLALCSVRSSGIPRIDALDVGQGDATLITSSTGFRILFDTGGRLGAAWGEDGYANVVTELRKLGIRQLDVVIVSHPDPDHTGALEAVLRSFDVKRLVLDYYPSNDVRLERSLGTWCVYRLHCDLKPLATTEWRLGDLQVTLLRADDVKGVPLFDNERSSALLVKAGASVALVTADLPQWRELELLQRVPSKIDLLKLGHHGSRTSSAPEFIRTLNPRIIWSSHGFLNRFGHPHTEALDEVHRIGAKFVTTADRGSIAFEWRGGRWGLVEP